jgi:hypothetical protein
VTGDRTPEVVAPSGVYGFRQIKNIGGPVVQVVENTSGRGWLGTPASYYAADVARWPAGYILSVYGSWRLSAEDSAAFLAYARTVAGQ